MRLCELKQWGMPETLDLLTSAEAAQLLGVSQSTLSRLVTTDRLRPALRAPGKVGACFFRPADVHRFIERRDGEKRRAKGAPRSRGAPSNSAYPGSQLTHHPKDTGAPHMSPTSPTQRHAKKAK